METRTSQHPECLWGEYPSLLDSYPTKINHDFFCLIFSIHIFSHSITSVSMSHSVSVVALIQQAYPWLDGVSVLDCGTSVSVVHAAVLKTCNGENYQLPGRPSVLRSRWMIAFISGDEAKSLWMLANWACCGSYALFTCTWLQYQTANREHLGLFVLVIHIQVDTGDPHHSFRSPRTHTHTHTHA